MPGRRQVGLDVGAGAAATRIRSQAGRTAVVTGASSGLGLFVSRVLVASGARVLMGCRDVVRARSLVRRINERGPGRGRAEVLLLDLADLDTVERSAEVVLARCRNGVDLLVNNAGIMGHPLRRTASGQEAHFAVNFLGHAALTWHLLEGLCQRTTDSRVVMVSSSEHARADLRIDDVAWRTRRYSARQAYADSKKACLMFAVEFDRRAAAAGLPVVAAAADPGVVYTRLMVNTLRSRSRLLAPLGYVRVPGFTRPVSVGAIPIMYAALADPVPRGALVTPPRRDTADAVGVVRNPLSVEEGSTAGRLWHLAADVADPELVRSLKENR